MSAGLGGSGAGELRAALSDSYERIYRDHTRTQRGTPKVAPMTVPAVRPTMAPYGTRTTPIPHSSLPGTGSQSWIPILAATVPTNAPAANPYAAPRSAPRTCRRPANRSTLRTSRHATEESRMPQARQSTKSTRLSGVCRAKRPSGSAPRVFVTTRNRAPAATGSESRDGATASVSLDCATTTVEHNERRSAARRSMTREEWDYGPILKLGMWSDERQCRGAPDRGGDEVRVRGTGTQYVVRPITGSGAELRAEGGCAGSWVLRTVYSYLVPVPRYS